MAGCAYQVNLLKYCAEGRNERFGVIEFAVGVDVCEEFKKAVGEVAETDWKPLLRNRPTHHVLKSPLPG